MSIGTIFGPNTKSISTQNFLNIFDIFHKRKIQRPKITVVTKKVTNQIFQTQRFDFYSSHSSILEACECFHPMFLDGDMLNITACNLTSDSEDLSCVEEIMYQLDNNIRNCSCGPNCQEMDYEVFISQSKWPAKYYQVRF